jgi:hypothetical protein
MELVAIRAVKVFSGEHRETEFARGANPHRWRRADFIEAGSVQN